MTSIAGLTPDVQRRIRMERRILRKLLTTIVQHGMWCEIDNGEECSNASNKVSYLMDFAGATDMETVGFGIEDTTQVKGYKWKGWFNLVYGNSGWDVISDYSANQVTEMIMAAGVDEIIDKVERGVK